MTFYAAMRLLHVVSAFGIFVFMGVELAAEWLLRRAVSPADVRRAFGIVRGTGRFGALALFGVLIPGLYLAYRWGFPWWTRIALLNFIAAGALGGSVTGRRVRALLGKIGDGTAPLTEAQAALVYDPALRWSLCLRIALVCGIALLMLTKPVSAVGAVSIVAVLLAIAALVAQRAISPRPSIDRPSSAASQARAR